MPRYGENEGVLLQVIRMEDRCHGTGGDDCSGGTRNRRAYHCAGPRAAPLHYFLRGRGRRGGLPEESGGTWREDSSATREYSHRHVRMDAGPGRQHGGLVESESIVASQPVGHSQVSYRRSKMPAAPMPPPMHMVTMP